MISSEYSFVVFSDDWGRHPSSCQHLMKRFMPEHRFLWANTVGLRPPRVAYYDLKRSISFFKRMWHPLSHEPQNNLWVYSPFLLPWNNVKIVRRWNQECGKRSFNKVLQKLQFSKRISLTTVPNACDWIGGLGEEVKIYYCVDDFAQWPGMYRDTILEMESKLLETVDLFVAVSKSLLERKSFKGKPSLYLPHGVDVKHFKGAYQEENLRRISNQRFKVVYFGVLDERLDYPMLENLVGLRPQWDWYFMGPCVVSVKDLKKHKNCFFLSPVDYASLPQALRPFDVLLLPYVQSSLTQAIHPLKLRECLATGKPVVARLLPETKPFESVVSLCENSNQFLEAMGRVVDGHRKCTPQAQWDFIQADSWEERSKTLEREIQQFIESK